MTVIHTLLVRKIMLLSLFGDARFKRTLDHVAAQIIGALPASRFEPFKRMAARSWNLAASSDRVSLSEIYARIESASEKIGKYNEINTKATKMPMQIIIRGSIKLSAAVVLVATSSS